MIPESQVFLKTEWPQNAYPNSCTNKRLERVLGLALNYEDKPCSLLGEHAERDALDSSYLRENWPFDPLIRLPIV